MHKYFILDSSVVIKKEEAVSPDGVNMSEGTCKENVCPVDSQNDDGIFLKYRVMNVLCTN